MKPLTAKQESFCQAVAKGRTHADAYREAYNTQGKAAGIQSNAYKLLQNADVALRVSELRAPAVAAVEAMAAATQKQITVDLNRAVFENAAIAFSDVRGLFDDVGNLRPSKDWPDHLAIAVASVETRQLFGEGKDGVGQIGVVHKVKLWDKGAAIDRFFKHFGGYKEDNEQKGPLADLNRDEIKAVVDGIRKLLGTRKLLGSDTRGAA